MDFPSAIYPLLNYSLLALTCRPLRRPRYDFLAPEKRLLFGISLCREDLELFEVLGSGGGDLTYEKPLHF